MTTFELVCALLAAAAYKTSHHELNQISPIAGAKRLDGTLGYRASTINGFEASAFEYEGSVVISFAGTNPSEGIDLVTNLFTATGKVTAQLQAAAEFYQAIKNDPVYGSKPVVFTGHSLGGGLAAAMGVLFNKQAVTFDPAPFRLAATQANAQEIQTYLTQKHPTWPADSDLASFTSTNGNFVALEVPALVTTLSAILPPIAAIAAARPYPLNIRGEGNITAYSVSGEFLTAGFRGLFGSDLNKLKIQSGTSPNSIDINPAGANVTGVDLHSMNMLIAVAKEPRLIPLLQQNSKLVESMFDKTLYSHASKEGVPDIWAKLIQKEFEGSAGVAGTGLLTKFAGDFERLTSATGASAGTCADPTWQKALITAGLDYYYNKDAASATQFFALNAGALHFDFAAIGVADLTTLKALPLLREAASSTTLGADPFNLGYLRQATSWHVQTGAGSMIWTDTAIGVVNDAAIGGAQDDVLHSGAGNDYLLGGAGVDILDGGTGNDLLAGGAGSDAYQFSGDFGNDTITDSDGLGNITVDGIGVTGGNQVVANVWENADATLVYTKVGADLIVGQRSSAGAGTVNGTIRITNWQSGQLGITLSGTPADVAQPITTGDDFRQLAAGGNYAGLVGNDLLIAQTGAGAAGLGTPAAAASASPVATKRTTNTAGIASTDAARTPAQASGSPLAGISRTGLQPLWVDALELGVEEAPSAEAAVAAPQASRLAGVAGGSVVVDGGAGNRNSRQHRFCQRRRVRQSQYSFAANERACSKVTATNSSNSLRGSQP